MSIPKSTFHHGLLALRDTRRENSYPSHAGRVLRELAEFGMHKHVGLNDRILSIAIRRGADAAAYQERFTPLDIVDAVLKKHIEHRESDDDTLYLSAHGLNYEVVGPVRRRALPAIRTALWMESPEAQARAVQSIRSVLQADLRGFGRVPTDAEHAWQDVERLEVIAIIEERGTARETSVPLLFCLTGTLQDFKAPPGDPVLARASAVLKRLRRPRELTMFAALCSASWDDWRTPQVFKQRVDKASVLFVKMCRDVEARVDRLSQLTEAAQKYGVFEDTGASAVCEQLCAERLFLEALIERVFAGDTVVARFLSVAIRELRRTDLTACRNLLRRALKSVETNIRGAAVHGIAFGSQTGSEIDIDMLAEAAHDESPWVRRLVVDGLRVIARQNDSHTAAAVEHLTRVSPQSDKDAAEWWCGALADHAGTLSAEQVNRVLAELINIDRLDDYHTGELLQNLTGTHPRELATFLVRRLDEYSRRVERDEYGYRPVPDFMRHSLEAVAPHARELLAAFRDSVPTAPPHLKQELIDMFWAIGGRSDEALALVDEWLHSTECSVARTALSLLNEAPHRLCLERPIFAGHVLQVCAGTALSDRAEKAIVANCRPTGWSRKKGSAPEEHTKIVADARELARKWSGTFVADAMVRIADQIELESRAIAAEDGL